VDTFAIAYSGTAKEHVGRTYAGVDGFCPLASYLGTQGFCLELALRPGTQHSAGETEYNIERVLPLAARVSAGTANGGGAPLLFRADSGFDSARLMWAIDIQAQQLKRAVAFIIKWNPRKTPVETIAKAWVADADTLWSTLREGKRECLWSDAVELKHAQHIVSARRIYRLTERTIDKRGQQMLRPEYVLEGWSTTLPDTETFCPQQIIDLYAAHGTHEQFHSEFKTDMDLVRLPSGKFDTNYLVCALGPVAMNLLRLIGKRTLHGNGVSQIANRHKPRSLTRSQFKLALGRWHTAPFLCGVVMHKGKLVFEQLNDHLPKPVFRDCGSRPIQRLGFTRGFPTPAASAWQPKCPKPSIPPSPARSTATRRPSMPARPPAVGRGTGPATTAVASSQRWWRRCRCLARGARQRQTGFPV